VGQASQRKRTAVVGCGKAVATHASAWRRLPTSEFVAARGVVLKRARTLAPQFNGRAFGDLDEMPKREQVKVLSICTLHAQHVPSDETGRRGLHVIVEKPLAVAIGQRQSWTICGFRRARAAAARTVSGDRWQCEMHILSAPFC
jgi:predicted dehydrogenase